MAQFSPEERDLMRNLGRQYPRFVEILSRWRKREMNQLPKAISGNVGVLQGRAQVLTEITQHVSGLSDEELP